MKPETKKRLLDYLLYLAIIISGIALDQLTKLLASVYLKSVPTHPIIEGVLHLTYTENRGAAFGMLADQRWIFMTVSTVAIIAMAAYLFIRRGPTPLYAVALSMVISGGIGNMIDRIALGYVVDFIDFRLINFAIFNGADSLVCVGAGLLILALVLDIIKEYRSEKEKKTGAEDSEK